jgi:acyl phosphate:glycerol-3-phosphate acyltransferase
MLITKFIYIIILSYLIGSIPSGLLVSKFQAKKDIRKFGSGKTGATNVLRTAGSKAAVIVVVADVLKGILPVILAGILFGNNLLVVGSFGAGALIVQVAAGLAAIAGHNWSLFLKFKGGRGVATYFGGLTALCPPAAMIGAETLFISAGLTRYASFGSLLGVIISYVVLVPLTIIYKFPLEYLGYALVGTLVIIIMHKDNINRLVTGTERKLGEKAEHSISSSESGA